MRDNVTWQDLLACILTLSYIDQLKVQHPATKTDLNEFLFAKDRLRPCIAG
jgi:hypothetical protein